MSKKLQVWLGISIGITGLLVIVFFVFFYRARLTIVPTPADATVTINGQPAGTDKALKLSPGTYTIEAAAPGYLRGREQIRLGVSHIVTLPISLRQIPAAQIVTDGVEFPGLSEKQDAIVYLGKNRTQFFKVNLLPGADGKPQVMPITNDRFSGVSFVVWSPKRDLALIRTSDGKTKIFDFQRYDLLHQEEKELDSNLLSVAWHPKLPEIIGYHAPATGERTLLRRDIITGEVTKLADLRELNLTNPTVSWSPDGRYIMMVEQAVYLFDMNTRTTTKVASTDGVLGAAWHPRDNRLLFSFPDGLRVSDVAGKQQTLNLRTDINKAIWFDSKSVLAAISTDKGQDRFVRTHATNIAERTSYSYTGTGNINAQQLVTTNNGERLWFISDKTLLTVRLEPESN